tara:strand:- start:165 stop:605 length:441 start_codon:yes stop_codon:yes gene_type:complete
MTKIKTFKGQIEKGTTKKIHLSTSDGLTGYKVTKFHGLPADVESGSNEAALQLYTNEGNAVTTAINFDNPEFLGCFIFIRDQGTVAITSDFVVFDHQIVNQDLFVTYDDGQGSATAFNFYLELEQVKLNINESTFTTLKNIRNSKQ